MTNSAPDHVLIKSPKKNGPEKVYCVKMATFGSMTYFLKVGQEPAKWENDCDT